MVAMTWRRSSAVRATRRWMAPAPRSKPARSTYIATITATRQNQRVSIESSIRRDRRGRIGGITEIGLGAVINFSMDQEEPEHGEHGVHTHEADEGEPGATRIDTRRGTVGSAHDAVDKPGLAAEFGSHPTGSIGDVREGGTKHQKPEHPTGLEKFLTPQEKGRKAQDSDEDRAEADPDVVAEIKKFNGIGPIALREGVKPLNVSAPFAVGEEAEHVANFQGIVELAVLHVGLAENGKRG